MQDNQQIQWSSELIGYFHQSQEALHKHKTITIPKPSDQLVITTDGSPLNKGLSATLFIQNNNDRKIGGFFSLKLKNHHLNWLPCDLEALAITSAIAYFGPYIKESEHTTQILTDCKQLCRGLFSASPRVSTFLSTLSGYNIVVNHLKGELNVSSDYRSRHPRMCKDATCQICKFVEETQECVVQSLTVSDVMSGSAKMTFLNHSAWRLHSMIVPHYREHMLI